MSNSTINPGSKADFLTFLQTENDLDPEFLDPEFLDSEFLEIVAETLEGLDDLTVSEEGDTNVGEGEMHPQSEGQRGEGSGSSRSDSRELVLLKSAAKQRTWEEVFKAALDASETDTSGGTRPGTADGQTGDQAGMAKEDAQISSRGSDTNAMTKGESVDAHNLTARFRSSGAYLGSNVPIRSGKGATTKDTDSHVCTKNSRESLLRSA